MEDVIYIIVKETYNFEGVMSQDVQKECFTSIEKAELYLAYCQLQEPYESFCIYELKNSDDVDFAVKIKALIEQKEKEEDERKRNTKSKELKLLAELKAKYES